MAELMYQYYKEKENYLKKKEAIFCLMEGSNMNWKNLYERCARELTKEDFAKEEAHILEKIKLKNYQSAVENLIAIRRIMKKNHWQQEWQQRYRNFKEKNKRKRLLMGLLDKW